MTVTPIFDDLAAAWAAPSAPPVPYRRVVAPGGRPSPCPRAVVVGSDAFGRGCLGTAAGASEPAGDEVTRLLEGARREAVALGRHWVGTVHLLLSAVRAGGDVGRAFGMRGVGPAVLLAALDDGDRGAGDPDEPDAGDPLRPAVSSVARTVLHRAAHRAAREERAVTAVELAVAVARSGRVAELLHRLDVHLDDLLDALAAATPAAGPPATTVPSRPTPPLRRVPVPVGVVAPVTVMLPTVVVARPRRVADVPA